MVIGSILIVIVAIAVIAFFFGYSLGGRKKGFMVYSTSELPRTLFNVEVVNIKSGFAVLSSITPKRLFFIVSTDVFGGKSIQPRDVVRHIKSVDEQKNLGIPFTLGFPPLVKVVDDKSIDEQV